MLIGFWECVFLEVNIGLFKENVVFWVYVCCDLVEDSYVWNNMILVLWVCDVIKDIKEFYNFFFYFDIFK